jgi:hypothetical protein
VRRGLAALVAALAAFAAGESAATASSSLQFGLYEEATTLFTPTNASGFNTIDQLGADVLRLNLYWYRVSPTRPEFVANPFDPAYDWSLYDRAIRLATDRGIRVLLSIWGTPGWANGGKGQNYAPDSFQDLKDFADAAAHRYSGHYAAEFGDPELLPLVDLWLAWNEPNTPTFLRPQGKVENGKGKPASPEIYARICNAIYAGVHKAGNEEQVQETVACGATNPRGNNIFKGRRASVSPILFLRELAAAGATFDVYAHHPYNPAEDLVAPGVPPRARTTVTMGNIGTLIAELTRLYGPQMDLWITEYGYQTNPPDRLFGVPLATQAAYMKQAHAIARKNPRIHMLLWFLLKDEPAVSRWQSGVIDAKGKRKPSFATFRSLAQ